MYLQCARFGFSCGDHSNMKHLTVAALVLVAGYAVSSEPNGDNNQDPVDLPDNIEQALIEMDLNDVDKQKLTSVFGALVGVAGSMQLIEGDRDNETAQLVDQEFLESADTEWWACGDPVRFFMDSGCGDDNCPVRLAANRSMNLGKVVFAGEESYAWYAVQGLERNWNWCSEDESYSCSFVLDAVGDGSYYDFNKPSTTTREDGSRTALPAGRFKCERFFPSN